MNTTIATADDVVRIAGELDSLVIARILSYSPTIDELEEAVRAEDECERGDESPPSPTPRVGELRAIVARVRSDEDAGAIEAWRGV